MIGFLSGLAGPALLVACLATLVDRYADLPAAARVADAGLVLFFLFLGARVPVTGRVFMIVAAILGAYAAGRGDDLLALSLRALEPARSFATLFVALGVLRLAAESSRAIRRSGRHLLSQPPSISYLAITKGAALFAFVLGFGVLNVLGTMVRRGARLLPAELRAAPERLGMIGVVRGFCLQVTCNPIGLPLAIVLQFQAGADWRQIVPPALGTFGLFLILGWCVELLTARGGERLKNSAGDRGWAVHIPVIVVIAAVVFGTMALEQATGRPLIVGAMTAAPAVSVLWLLAQARGLGLRRSVALTGRRVTRHVMDRFPGYRLELSILCGASVVGTFLAAVLPIDQGLALLQALALPPVIVPALMAATVILAAQVGINPIATVLLMLSAIPQPEALGVSSTVVGVTILGGWAIAVGSSPFAITTLITSSLTGLPSHVIGWRWNGVFSIVCFVFLTLYMAALVAYGF